MKQSQKGDDMQHSIQKGLAYLESSGSKENPNLANQTIINPHPSLVGKVVQEEIPATIRKAHHESDI